MYIEYASFYFDHRVGMLKKLVGIEITFLIVQSECVFVRYIDLFLYRLRDIGTYIMYNKYECTSELTPSGLLKKKKFIKIFMDS